MKYYREGRSKMQENKRTVKDRPYIISELNWNKKKISIQTDDILSYIIMCIQIISQIYEDINIFKANVACYQVKKRFTGRQHDSNGK